MKTAYIYISILLISSLLFSCKKYEDYTKDFDRTTVYFATQKPLRTIVAYDVMEFKVGVALAGKRVNTVAETAQFEIDPTLLSTVPGANKFQLLPSDYYTLSNSNTFTVQPGSFIGDVTVTLNKAAFTADPLATGNNYAIPLRITSTSADSVLAGKNYTIVVVKYISPYHGTYYHKGVETNGTTVNRYSESDLNKNATWDMGTIALNQIQAPGAGSRSTPKLALTVNNDNTVSVINQSLTAPNNIVGSGTYLANSKTFYLDYNYNQGTNTFEVKDTLILRQAPELDLRFQEW